MWRTLDVNWRHNLQFGVTTSLWDTKAQPEATATGATVVLVPLPPRNNAKSASMRRRLSFATGELMVFNGP
jgi:hypothetical protein